MPSAAKDEDCKSAAVALLCHLQAPKGLSDISTTTRLALEPAKVQVQPPVFSRSCGPRQFLLGHPSMLSSSYADHTHLHAWADVHLLLFRGSAVVGRSFAILIRNPNLAVPPTGIVKTGYRNISSFLSCHEAGGAGAIDINRDIPRLLSILLV